VPSNLNKNFGWFWKWDITHPPRPLGAIQLKQKFWLVLEAGYYAPAPPPLPGLDSLRMGPE